jgi:hypothetical protein
MGMSAAPQSVEHLELFGKGGDMRLKIVTSLFSMTFGLSPLGFCDASYVVHVIGS